MHINSLFEYATRKGTGVGSVWKQVMKIYTKYDEGQTYAVISGEMNVIGIIILLVEIKYGDDSVSCINNRMKHLQEKCQKLGPNRFLFFCV